MKQTYYHTADQTAGVYLTPRWLTDALGPFDLDPCASDPRPWDIAKVNLTGEHNGGLCGLKTPWKGFVWLNPPYGVSLHGPKFIKKLAEHPGGGVALLNANTATKVWTASIFPSMSAILFLQKRISFLKPTGEETLGTFGNPVLVAFGARAAKRLKKLSAYGHYLENHD